ncbi:kinesin-like protein KIF20B isoform X3 [Asterias rubens]|uniref:kinesin-like protein KIF20B isoform X3 n=1 Tax=Asterias rubens TaxID=7604 RepID=UPI00145570BA|nr:kinesin-like protein KIF20B isoform X3 [Asterias rubens]
MANTTSFDDLSDSEDQDVTSSIDDLDTTQDVCKKNLLEDFAADAKLTRQSVAHGREHMQVHLRIRPFTATERDKGEYQDCMEIQETSTLLMRAPKDSFTFKSSQRGFSNMTHKFTFSRIFGEDTSQKDFFDDTMLSTVKDFIDGQNCLVFTYGVTNAGKTYTIQGAPQDGGILPRSLDVIFNSIEGKHYTSMQLKPRYFCDVTKLTERQLHKEEDIRDSVLSMAARTLKQDNSVTDDADDSRASNYTTATEDSRSEISFHNVTDDSVPNVLEDIRCRIPDDTSIDVEAQGPVKFAIWVSFAEIYNEYIYDLLEAIPKGKKVRRQPLKLSEDKNGQIFIKGLKEIYCRSADEAYKILKIGQQNLSIAATKLNQCSSRSHCIFSIKILRVVDCDNPHVARVSKLSFCDLAGSERYTRTQNTGDRLKEAGNINTSLLTLGKCIHTLRYNQNHPKTHPKIIPFRESKLTRLFQSFFMGKGKASMIVNVNQCASGFDETIHVLKFSAIAKQVTTITSKLDNKWKIPAVAAPPKYPSSRALSMAINQSMSRNRVSVAWATPGLNPDSNLDLTTVDETFIEEDEEDEETEDEEGDVETTPKESKAKLVSLVESLKTQLIETKKLQMMMEVQIRAEVCQEMSQQLVQIESEYKDRMEEERMINEEMYEKRLEMYEKSVKKPRKRPHIETVDTDDEFVSSLLLHAEQSKVQEREKTIRSLRGDVQKLKDTLDETEEKMNIQDQTSRELQGLVETSSLALEEAKAKMCIKDQKLLDMETKLKETYDAVALKEQELVQECSLLTEKIKENEAALTTMENANQELQEKLSISQEKHATQVSQLEAEFKILQESLKTYMEAATTGEDAVGKLSEALSEAADLRLQLQSTTKKDLQTTSAREEAEKYKTELEELKKMHESELQSFRDELKASSKTLVRVGLQVEKEKEKNFDAEEKIVDLEERLSSLNEDKNQSSNDSEEEEQKILTQEKTIKEYLDKLSKQEKSIETSEATIQGLESQLSEEQMKTAEVLAKKEELAKSIKELEENLDDLQTHFDQTNSKGQEATVRAATQEKSIVNCEATIKGLESQLNQEQMKTAEVLAKKEELAKSIKDLEENLDDLQTRFDQTNSKCHEATVRAVAHEKSIENCEAKIKGLESQLNQEQMKSAEVLAKREELEKTIKDLEENLDDLQTSFDQTNSKVQETTVRAAAQEKSIENREATIKGLESQLNQEQKKTAEVLAKKEELEKNIKDIEENLDDLQTRFDQTNSNGQEATVRAAAHEKSIKNCEATIKGLESQLNQEQMKTAEVLAKKEELEKNIKDLEENLDDLQTRFDQTNSKNQEARVRAAALENDLEYVNEEIKKEQKAHNDTKMVASDYGCQVSLLRSQLQTAERMSASSGELAKRYQELEGSLKEMQRTLTDKEIALAEASKWQGDATDLRSQLKMLDDKLKETEQKRSTAETTVQNLSQQCTGLQQSLAQKAKETMEIQQLKDQQKTNEERCIGLEKTLEEQKAKTKSKADTIKQLMNEIEMQCHKLQAVEKDTRANSEVISVLKAGMQEQEATMASQDEILASKEQELDSLRTELTDLQDKYSDLHTVSSENKQAVRESNRNHDQSKKEKETMRKELNETLSKLRELEREHEEHKKKLVDTKAALSDYVKEKRAVEGDLQKLKEQLERSQTSLADAQQHPQDCPDKIENVNLLKKITALEQEVMKQVAEKDETLKTWRKEKDNLVGALQEKMESLLEDNKTKITQLEEKEEHIKHLKDKMVSITQSQSMTDDESDSDDTRGSKRRSGKSNEGVQKEVQRLTELLETEREDKKTALTSSKRIVAEKMKSISELEAANRTLQTQLGLIEQVSVDVKPLRNMDSSLKDSSSSPSDQPESPDLFAMEVKDQESFSLPGRRRTRVQMDMTPLQKKQPARKGRANTRRTKKRKSMEEMEEFNDDAYGKRNRGDDGSTRVTRSSRKTRAVRGEEDLVDENAMPEAPLTSGRGKRAPFSKIGDMLQNSPIAKSASSLKSSSRSQPSAKKFVENATSHMTSPTKSPEVQFVSYHGPPTTEKKRKRLLKKDISAPFQSSPFEMVNHGESRGDSSHSIVTRKLRSRNTRV